MTGYIARRLLLMIPTLLGVSLLVTALLRLLPGDAVDILAAGDQVIGGGAAFKEIVDGRLVERGTDPLTAAFGDRIKIENEIVADQLRKGRIDFASATDAQKQAARNEIAVAAHKDGIRRRMGLDKGYFEQWFTWMTDAIQGDLGESLIGKRSVEDELRRRIPASVELGALAMIVSILVGVPIGVLSALRQDSWLDYVTRSFAIAMLALPSFFVATVVIAVALRWQNYAFPAFYKDLWKDPSTNLQLVVAPAVILGFGLSGTLLRLTRAQMLEVLRQDYMRTAWSKGLSTRVVVLRHGVRNALVPVVTVIGLQVPVLVGGSLVLEQIFGIRGVAQYFFTSIVQRDFPVVIAVNMLIAVVIVVTNLVVDITYVYLDPRVTFT